MDNIKRRKSHAVRVGGSSGGSGAVVIGGNSPVVIQSMTNTDTADMDATVNQIMRLADAGSELVRITVNNEAAAAAVPEICKKLRAKKCEVPIVGDFHYNGHILLEKFPQCARALDKYRINPGNVEGTGLSGVDLNKENFDSIIKCAAKYDKPVRIGVNWGSLDGSVETLVASALDSATRAEKLGLGADKIILSVKASDVQCVIKAYEMLAERCEYALHLGLTEAGSGAKGLVASSAALAVLLQKGIGDTIRISLTPRAGESRVREVEACRLLLQTMGLRQFYPLVTSCPGCGRTDNDLFQRLAEDVDEYVKARMPEWARTHKGVENLKIAVMGCVVNGPGEARHADITLSLPGRSEKPIATVFARGKLVKTLRGLSIEEDFLRLLEDFVKKNY